MKKKLVAILLTLLTLCVSAFCFTACGGGTEGLEYERTSNKNEYSVVGFGDAKDSRIVIPSSYNGLPVTTIEVEAFKGCAFMTNIVIPESVTSIGNYAFYDCASLTSVTIGKNVTSIGYGAFDNCYKLVEVINKSPYITVTKGSTNNGYVGEYALSVSNCDNSYVSKLSTDSNGYITYTDGEDKILVGYIGTKTELNLPSNITKINQYAFYKNDNITSVTIPNNVESIGDAVFLDCNSLTKVDYTGTIDQWIEINFGGGVLASTRNLYINSELVTEANLTTATKIPDYAFSGCTSLTSVTIGDSATSIGDEAFSGCDSLTKVNYTGTIDQWVEIEFYGYESNPLSYAGKLYINNELVTEANIITATKISDCAFFNCNSLESVIIGDSVESIGSSAFFGCTSLTSVTIGDSVTSIGYDAFAGCPIENATIPTRAIAYIPQSNLKTVVITSGESISSYAFDDCYSLESVTIGDSVTSISSSAFENCYSLTSVTIGDSVTSIGYDAFDGCPIESATIPTSAIAYIPQSNLKTVVITSGESIGSSAFYNCHSLTSVVIGDSVTSIGSSAFYGCNSLTSVTIGDSVTSIGSSAFKWCDSLTSVEIPDSVTSIGSSAFYNCHSLTSVVIGDSVTSIGEGAFGSCDSLTSVTIGYNVTSIGDYAFLFCHKLVEVINRSEHITVTKGSSDNGYIGYYALSVSNNDDSYISILTIDSNGYITYTEGEDKILVNYVGGATELTLPSDITKIYQYAFCNNNNITSVTIGNSVESIGSMAFAWCDSLESVTIGDSVTSIGDEAFYGCNSLTSVYYKGSASEWNSIDIDSWDNSSLTNATRYYYIENEADVPTDSSNYWHYVDGVPTIWGINPENPTDPEDPVEPEEPVVPPAPPELPG